MANLYYTFGGPFLPGTKARSDEVNIEYEAIESAFDQLPGSTDAITRGVTYLGVESGSGNNYVVTLPDTRTAYQEGDRIIFRATHTNTGSASINVDTIGVVTAVRPDDTVLEPGDILAGVYYEFIYDSVSTHFQMINQPASFLIDMDARVDWAEEWAINPEDSLVSASAGGNGVSDYSALHYAAKASADATSADADATAAAASAAAAAASAASINLPAVGAVGNILVTNSVPDGYDSVAFEIVNDATPQLGGDLDVDGNDIVSTSNGNINVAPHGTGEFQYDSDRVAKVVELRNPNKLTNGDFTIWQRATSFTAPANGDFLADRWFWSVVGAGTVNVTRNQTGAGAALSGRPYSMKFTVAAADSSIASGDIYTVSTNIESIDVEDLSFGQTDAKELTISFAHAHSSTGTYCVALRNSSVNRYYIFEYTQSVADTWEVHTETLTADTTGTWGSGEGTNGLRLAFILAGGSGWQGSAGAWAAGNKLCTSNQTNIMGTASNTFHIGAIKLEIGDTNTGWHHVSFGEQLNLCKRYYEKSFRYGIKPAASLGHGATPVGAALNSVALYTGVISYKVEKAKPTPTITLWRPFNSTTAARWAYYNSGWQTPTSDSAVYGGSAVGFQVILGTVSVTSGSAYLIEGHWESEAEI